MVLATLHPELLLVKAGRCRGLRFGASRAAEARYDAGLKDRLAIVSAMPMTRTEIDDMLLKGERGLVMLLMIRPQGASPCEELDLTGSNWYWLRVRIKCREAGETRARGAARDRRVRNASSGSLRVGGGGRGRGRRGRRCCQRGERVWRESENGGRLTVLVVLCYACGPEGILGMTSL